MRTARENIADLTDGGLLVEYGGLAVAAQRGRRPLTELEAKTPADGVITGLGRINAELFGPQRCTCAIVAYDYTVMSGTQGHFSHRKTDRVLEQARLHRYPLVLFAEGAGDPGDRHPDRHPAVRVARAAVDLALRLVPAGPEGSGRHVRLRAPELGGGRPGRQPPPFRPAHVDGLQDRPAERRAGLAARRQARQLRDRPRDEPAWQHDARRNPDGTLSIFDNGAAGTTVTHKRVVSCSASTSRP